MSRLSKNIFYNVTGQGLILALGFVAVRYVFRRLGGDALGLIYFAATLNAGPVVELVDHGASSDWSYGIYAWVASPAPVNAALRGHAAGHSPTNKSAAR